MNQFIRPIFLFALIFWRASPTLHSQNWTAPQTAVTGLTTGGYYLHGTPLGSQIHVLFQNYSASELPRYILFDSASWSMPTQLGMPFSTYATLAVSAGQEPVAVWSQGSSYLTYDLFLSQKNSGTWSAPQLIYPDTLPCFFPSLLRDSQNNLAMAWLIGNNNYMSATPGDVFFATISSNQILGKTNISQMNLGGQSISLAEDSSGTLHLVWEAHNSQLQLVQFHSYRLEGVWSAPDSVGLGQLTKLKSDSDGSLNLFYLAFIGAPYPGILYRSYHGTAWGDPVQVSRISGPWNLNYSITNDSKGRIIVGWIENGSLRIVVRRNQRWSVPRQLDFGNGDIMDLAVTDSAQLHAMWISGSSMFHSFSKIDETAPTFVTSPIIPDTTEAGTYQKILWKTADNEGVYETEFSFSSDNGKTWSVIDTLTGADTTMTWLTPSIYSDSCRIKISAFDFWMNRAEIISSPFSLANIPPRPFNLFYPGNGFHSSSAQIYFRWWAANDGLSDTVRYSLRIASVATNPSPDNLDTTIASLRDTSFLFVGNSWFKRDTSFVWSVLAQDGLDTTFNTGGTRVFTISSKLLTSVDDEQVALLRNMLLPNFPNPFNPSTTIPFVVAAASPVSLSLYDVLGRRIRTIVDGEFSVGFYSFPLDAGDLPTGIYFYTIAIGQFRDTRKLMILK